MAEFILWFYLFVDEKYFLYIVELQVLIYNTGFTTFLDFITRLEGLPVYTRGQESLSITIGLFPYFR